MHVCIHIYVCIAFTCLCVLFPLPTCCTLIELLEQHDCAFAGDPAAGAVHEAVIKGAFVPGLPQRGRAEAKPSAPAQARAVATPLRSKWPKGPRRARSAPITPTVREPTATESPGNPAQAVPPPPSPAPSAASTASMYEDGTYWKMLDCMCTCLMHGVLSRQ